MRQNWMAIVYVLVLGACQPQQPNEIPRSRSALESDNTPSRADPSQTRATAADAVNPQEDARGRAVPVGTAPGSGVPGSGSNPPTAEQIDDAMAACGRLPADQQEACRSRIAPAASRVDETKDR
jgi:hypothetical protein